MNEIVAIVGSRKYSNLSDVAEYVEALPFDVFVISGKAVGVDIAARTAAIRRGLFVLDVPVEPAHWERYGKAAGPLRNEVIAQVCTRLVAFWDGKSRGTKSAIAAAESLDKPVEVKTP